MCVKVERFWNGPFETINAHSKPGLAEVGLDENSIACSAVAGHFELPAAERIISMANEVVAERGSVVVFGQWHAMASYDTACRAAMTRWAVSLGPKLVAVHLLTGTKLVGMGVSVASIFVRQLHHHDTAEEFSRAYARARTEFRRSP